MARTLVNLSIENGGLGDIISLIPTIRALKRKYPDRELIVITYFQNIDVFAYCPYVDYIVPCDIIQDWPTGLKITSEDEIFALTHSFLSQHKDHIVRSPISEIGRMSPEGVPLEYELSVREFDFPIIKQYQQKLRNLAKGKKIVGIGPAITMYSRMYPKSHWRELTRILQENGYFVVSLGHKCDLEVDVDFDARDLYPVRYIPKILDIFDAVFVVNSGMMHVAAINSHVHIVLLNVGQFPAELIVPWRKGKIGHNTTIIKHDCPITHTCLMDHLTEKGINAQCSDFINRWEKETRKEFPADEGLLPIKFTCWKYCNKDHNKYSCSNLNPQKVFQAFRQRKSTTLSVPDQGMPIFHGEYESAVEDYKIWKAQVMLGPSQKRIYINVLDTIGDLHEKMRCVKTLFPDYTLVVIGRKKDATTLQNCEHVHYVLCVELLSSSIQLMHQDVMLKI